MAEYFDISDSRYYKILYYPYKSQRLRVEFLDHFENTLYRVEQDIDSSEAGKIVNNNTQGTRRSFSFNLINLDGVYNLINEDTFWFNRKFRVYLGVTDNTDTYWFSKGVYITKNADLDSFTKTVSLEGVDKYSQLDGTLNVLQADEMDTVFEVGTKIDNVVRDILLMDMGNGMVLDPIEPIIDPVIGEQKLYKEFTMSPGSYYGDFLTEIMTSFGCDIFYDTLGRLTIRRIFNEDRPYWYAFKSAAYTFNDEIWGYQSPRISFDMNGVNKIIVSNESVENENVSATALNTNPRSPLCYYKIGRRTLPENGGIIYISLGDKEIDTPETKCAEYAAYRLMQETCLALEASFQCPPIYHLCEGDVITIADKNLGMEQEDFIIDTITISSSTDEMSVSATNVKYLPTDIYIDSRYTELSDSSTCYTITYDLNGGSGSIPRSITARDGLFFKVATGYDFATFSDTIYNNDSDYELLNWTGSDGKSYVLGEDAGIPPQDMTLYANWIDLSDKIMTIDYVNSLNTPLSGYAQTCINYYPGNNVNIDTMSINNNKYYFRDYRSDKESQSYSTTFPAGSISIKYATDLLNMDESFNVESFLAYLYNNAGAHNNVKIKLPDALTKLYFMNSANLRQKCSSFVLPKNIEKITYGNCLLMNDSLTSMTLNYEKPLEVISSDGSPFLSYENNLTTLIANKDVTIRNESSSSSSLSYFCESCPLQEIDFKGNLSLYNVTGFRFNNTAIPSNARYNFADVNITNTRTYTSVATSYFFSGNINTQSDATLSLKSLNASSNSAFSTGGYLGIRAIENIQLGSLDIDGDVTVEYKNQVLSYVTLTQNTDVVINGNLTLNDAGNCLMYTNFTSLTITGDTFINSELNYISGNSICANNSFLQVVKFYGEFHIYVNQSSLFFMNSNPNLTDVYFYSDVFDVNMVTYALVFYGNNPLFKIHGISGSIVETFCRVKGITFVPLTAAELEEVKRNE